jgi:hypothetical protein
MVKSILDFVEHDRVSPILKNGKHDVQQSQHPVADNTDRKPPTSAF